MKVVLLELLRVAKVGSVRGEGSVLCRGVLDQTDLVAPGEEFFPLLVDTLHPLDEVEDVLVHDMVVALIARRVGVRCRRRNDGGVCEDERELCLGR